MTTRTLPSQAYLIQCFEYDPLTGVLAWRERPRDHFKSQQAWNASNTKCQGKPIVCKSDGYLVAGLGGVNWRVHRIIWKMVHGTEPDEIDHKNRDRSDNRLANLRPATSAENKRNTVTRSRVGRVSAHKGVSLNWGKWAARIHVRGKTICLGTFDSELDAAAAYVSAAERYHGDFAPEH